MIKMHDMLYFRGRNILLKLTYILLLELLGILNGLNPILPAKTVQLSGPLFSCLTIVMSWGANGGLALEIFNLFLVTVRIQSSK